MSDSTLRESVATLLSGRGAHASFEDAVKDVDESARHRRLPNVPHTLWRLLAHLHTAQHDLLKYSTDRDYESPPWPEGYWPDGGVPATPQAWDDTVQAYLRDREAFIALVNDESIDLLAPLPQEPKHTVLRQALLAADHAAYHIGQMIVVRRGLGEWKD